VPDREPLDVLSEDVAELKRWTERHENEHNAAQELLASIVTSLATHQTNHHSRASVARQTVSIGAVLAILAAVAEAVRQLWL
jgi:hypothetical protein